MAATAKRTAKTTEALASELRIGVGLLVRRLRQAPTGGELTLPESSALARLDRGGPATASALAKLEQISPQSMGATLAALEARGLVAAARPTPTTAGAWSCRSPTPAAALRDRRNARTEQLAAALAAELHAATSWSSCWPRRRCSSDWPRASDAPARAADDRPLGEATSGSRSSNTTMAVFMSALDGSIVIIALPAIFRGIHLDPLAPGNIVYLLWMIMGYRLVQAVLVVSFGRLGDMYGRVRIYNAGFAVFTAASILLSFDPLPRRQRRAVADRLAGRCRRSAARC